MITANDLHCVQFEGKSIMFHKIHGIRPVHPINFSPMTQKYIHVTNYVDCYVQALIKFLGGYYWITIRPDQIKNYREVINYGHAS